MGINGVVFGTLIAVLVRTVYFIWYLSRNILKRSAFLFIKSIVINLILSVLIILFANKVIITSSENLMTLIVDAIKVTLIVFPLVAAVNVLENSMMRNKISSFWLKNK